MYYVLYNTPYIHIRSFRLNFRGVPNHERQLFQLDTQKNITGFSVSDKPPDSGRLTGSLCDKPSEFDTFDAYVERFGCTNLACKINKFGANDQVVNDTSSKVFSYNGFCRSFAVAGNFPPREPMRLFGLGCWLLTDGCNL